MADQQMTAQVIFDKYLETRSFLNAYNENHRNVQKKQQTTNMPSFIGAYNNTHTIAPSILNTPKTYKADWATLGNSDSTSSVAQAVKRYTAGNQLANNLSLLTPKKVGKLTGYDNATSLRGILKESGYAVGKNSGITNELNDLLGVPTKSTMTSTGADSASSAILDAEKKRATAQKSSLDNIAKETNELKNQTLELKKHSSEQSKINKKRNESISQLRSLGGSLTDIGTKLTKYVTLPLIAAAAAGLNFDSIMEQANTNFGTLLGSKASGQSMAQQIQDLAVTTPLTITGTQQSATTMLAYDVGANDILPDMQMIGDVALGNNEKFQGLALAFAQTHAAGKLMGQDVLQYVSNGFNPLLEISDKTGISMAELRKKMQAGAISVEMVDAAFKSATSEGGRFYKGMDEASKTFAGQMSILGEQSQLTLGTVVKPLFDDLRLTVLPDLTKKVKEVKDWFSELSEEQKNTKLGIVAIVASVGPTLVAFGSLIKMVAGLKTAFITLGTTAGLAMGIIGVVAAVAVGITAYKTAQDVATRSTMNAGKEALTTLQSQQQLADTYLDLKTKIGKTDEEQQKLDQSATDLKTLFPDLTSVIDDQESSYSDLKDAIDNAIQSSKNMSAEQLRAAGETFGIKELGLTTDYKKATKKQSFLEQFRADNYGGGESAGASSIDPKWRQSYMDIIGSADIFKESGAELSSDDKKASFKIWIDSMLADTKQTAEDLKGQLEAGYTYQQQYEALMNGENVSLGLLGGDDGGSDTDKLKEQQKAWEKYKKELEKIKEEQEKLAESAVSVGDGFSKLEDMFSRIQRSGTSSTSGALGNLKRYASELKKWKTALDAIRKRGGSEAMVQELAAMGVGSRRLIENIAKSSNGMFNEFNKEYGTAKSIAYSEGYQQVTHQHTGTIYLKFTDSTEKLAAQVAVPVAAGIQNTIENDARKANSTTAANPPMTRATNGSSSFIKLKSPDLSKMDPSVQKFMNQFSRTNGGRSGSGIAGGRTGSGIVGGNGGHYSQD